MTSPWRKQTLWTGVLLLAALAVPLPAAHPRPSHAQPRQQASAPLTSKHILLLYSYGHGGKGVGIFDDGFLSAVGAAGISANNLYFEFLDLGRFEKDREHLTRLREVLLRKYATQTIDLIITVQQPALRFLLREGRQLASGAPVITVQAPMPTAVEAAGRRFLSLVAQFDIHGTLKRALDLFPDTRRVVVVAGSSVADRAMAAAASAAAPWQGKLECEYTSDLSLDQMLTRVANLPPQHHCLVHPIQPRSDRARHGGV